MVMPFIVSVIFLASAMLPTTMIYGLDTALSCRFAFAGVMPGNYELTASHSVWTMGKVCLICCGISQLIFAILCCFSVILLVLCVWKLTYWQDLLLVIVTSFLIIRESGHEHLYICVCVH